MKKSIFHFNFKFIFALSLMIFCNGSNATSTEKSNLFESKQKLHSIALEHLKQKTAQKIKNRKISISPISSRLKLKTCLEAITIEDKSPEKRLGRMTLKLTCPLPKWKLFIVANIGGELPVVVSTNGIIQQTTITKEDVKITYLPYKKIRNGAMKNIDSVIGMRTKKSISPNKIITINMLEPPYLVFKNQPITIVSYIGNLKVTSKGIALKNGTKEEQIPFKNISSGKTLKGMVIAPNKILVP